MDWIMIPLNVAIVFGTIYKLAELFAHRRERMMLINKVAEIKDVDFKGISLYSNSGNNGKYLSLRIGWLMLGVGAGFLLGFCINLWATLGDYVQAWKDGWWRYQDYVAGIVYLACICICGGIALLIAYKKEFEAEHPREKKEEEF